MPISADNYNINRRGRFDGLGLLQGFPQPLCRKIIQMHSVIILIHIIVGQLPFRSLSSYYSLKYLKCIPKYAQIIIYDLDLREMAISTVLLLLHVVCIIEKKYIIFIPLSVQ